MNARMISSFGQAGKRAGRTGLWGVAGMAVLWAAMASMALAGSFSYQGRLLDGGQPATGSYDLQFRLFDAASGGAQVGATVTIEDANVDAGLFTAALDFGAGVFTGADRWIEMGVRPGTESGAFALFAREKVLASPDALHAQSLGTASTQPLEIKVNNMRAFLLEYSATSPNVIGGHAANLATAGTDGAAIAGGGTSAMPNRVSGDFGAIGGGYGNLAAGTGVIAGGTENMAAGDFTTVGGGQLNAAGGAYSAIGGGEANQVVEAHGAVIGGQGNSVEATAAIIGGGITNTGKGELSFTGGGLENVTEGASSVIGGGTGNHTVGGDSAILGGANNSTMSDASAIAGGLANETNGEFTFIGGGSNNKASGVGASVLGGQYNSAGGDYSVALGQRAVIAGDHDGSILIADGTSVDFASAAANEFAVRATGGTRIVSAVDEGTGDPTAGVELAPGAGAWSTLSDRAAKDNFQSVDGHALLERLSALPILTWNYRAQPEGVRHIGPTAQDFHSAFALGENDHSISTVDADGVALAAIQALHQMIREQQARLDALERQNAQLQARMAELQSNAPGAAASAIPSR